MTAAAGSPLDASVGFPGGWSDDLFGDRPDDGPVMPQPQTEEIRRLARIIPRSVRLVLMGFPRMERNCLEPLQRRSGSGK